MLWHKDFHENVILLPDLDAYKLTTTTSRPGLSESAYIAGWRIERSDFSYVKQSYSTSFGHGGYAGLTDFPELYLNIVVRKDFIGPAVSHLLPLSVVLMMLFAILMLTSRRDPDSEGLSGFNTMSVIAACSGFFLVVIFLHIDRREKLAANQIIYLEWFYFITYSAILGVALNALHFAQTRATDNLGPQLSFWPATQFVLLVVTFLTFFG